MLVLDVIRITSTNNPVQADNFVFDMKGISLFLCTAVLFAILEIAIANLDTKWTVAQEEAFTKDVLLRRKSEAYEINVKKFQLARWKYYSNLTDENRRDYFKVKLEFANFLQVIPMFLESQIQPINVYLCIPGTSFKQQEASIGGIPRHRFSS